MPEKKKKKKKVFRIKLGNKVKLLLENRKLFCKKKKKKRDENYIFGVSGEKTFFCPNGFRHFETTENFMTATTLTYLVQIWLNYFSVAFSATVHTGYGENMQNR